jgi:hypothetical protein
MNKKLWAWSTIVLFLALLVVGYAYKVHANVFASDIKIVNPGGGLFDGELDDNTPGVGIQFRLNENATSVWVQVFNAAGDTVATINTGPHPQGVSLVVWRGLDDSGVPVPAGDYTFAVTAVDDIGHFGNDYDIIYARSGTVIFTRGGTSIRNPAAPNFGHPIGGNGGGGGLLRGPLNFFADGTGFEQVEPNFSRFSPFDVRSFGGTGRLYMITSDDDGYLYYSDRLDPLNKVYRISPDLDSLSLTVVTTSDDSSKKGLGIDVVGTGTAKTIYWGLANTVVRANIGEADFFDPANFEVVADFEPDTTGGDTNAVFIRDIVIDDSGFLYVSLRRGTPVTGLGPGLAVERYDISGVLPVNRYATPDWTIPVGFDNGDGRPVGFGIDRGDDLASNADDRIYFSNNSGTADGAWNTIHKIDDLATGGSTPVFADISGGNTTSAHADMTVDAAGNLIWFENSSEWLIAVSPPDGPNEFTTPAPPGEVITIKEESQAIFQEHPVVTAVRDVPNDQGNQVLVSWKGPVWDSWWNFFVPALGKNSGSLGFYPISHYDVYREIVAPSAKVSAASIINGPPGNWVLVGRTVATQTSNYHLVVPTVFNTTPEATNESTFYVSAVDPSGTRYDSNPGKGESIDNLVPTAPTNVVAKEVEGNSSWVELTWDESPDADFNYFLVVKGTEAGFNPETADIIGTTTETTLIDQTVSIGQDVFYSVAAVDFNGNRGKFSEEASVTITSVAGEGSLIPTEYALEQNYPNPFNPTTTIEFSLKERGHVSLKIYSMLGREVETVADKFYEAGRYSVVFDASRVSSGVYFYVLQVNGRNFSKKMSLLK